MNRYAFPNAWEFAQDRLALLEACHDPTSIRRAETLGVGPGWRCLDAGAGHGSFARWLASKVGEHGSVIASDRDVRLLEGTPGLEVRRMDIATDELPHIHPVLATADGPCREAWLAMLRMTESLGLDAEWARGLPEQLGGLGLVDVGAELDGQLFNGGSAPARFWALTWRQARDQVAAMGIPGEIMDEGRAVLEDRPGEGDRLGGRPCRRPAGRPRHDRCRVCHRHGA